MLIIGDGPEKQELEERSAALNLRDRVFFLGNVSNERKFQILNIADVYVCSSQHEGFGLVFLEAMAAGLPIVSYDKGGQVDFLINHRTGFLVRQGNVELFAQRTMQLCENPELRRTMGQFNRQRFADYSIRTCARRYQTLYESMVEKYSADGEQLREVGARVRWHH